MMSGPAALSLDDRIHYAYTHGIGMGQPFRHAPFTIRPFPFPKIQFDHAKSLATVFNILVERVTRNPKWLIETLRPTAVSDDFVRRLLEIYEKVLNEGVQQHLSLAINRSDYMLHAKDGDSRGLLQVEINTIASSFGSLSTRIAEMHREFDDLERALGSAVQGEVPVNTALAEIAAGIAAAHKAYVDQTGRETQSATVAMIVQPGEKNFADQRLLHYQLWKAHSVRCFRVTLSEAYEHGVLGGQNNKELIIAGECVSVVYFRSGYGPDDYPSEKEWEARLLMERSLAIKCPNIAYHLAGCKKIQQELATPGVLEMFVDSAPHRDALRSVFAGLYSLTENDSNKGELSVLRKRVLDVDGLNYVMKPQREGGGHNYYGPAVANALRKMPAEEQAAYILMERILPPQRESELVKDGAVIKADCICELGIYAVSLFDSQVELSFDTPTLNDGLGMNKFAGFLLRVKPISSDEGGVAAGYAVLSSPSLY